MTIISAPKIARMLRFFAAGGSGGDACGLAMRFLFVAPDANGAAARSRSIARANAIAVDACRLCCSSGLPAFIR
ncbi:MAG TPA: hypothetical protein VG308_14225 [Stellaceae bacterium]|nr:hypothetical protein [Stellaceae bacterium]